MLPALDAINPYPQGIVMVKRKMHITNRDGTEVQRLNCLKRLRYVKVKVHLAHLRAVTSSRMGEMGYIIANEERSEQKLSLSDI